MRGSGAYGEPQWCGPDQARNREEVKMHPYTARAIAVERMTDMRNEAAAYRRTRHLASRGRRANNTGQQVRSGVRQGDCAGLLAGR